MKNMPIFAALACLSLAVFPSQSAAKRSRDALPPASAKVPDKVLAAEIMAATKTYGNGNGNGIGNGNAAGANGGGNGKAKGCDKGKGKAIGCNDSPG